MSVQTSRGAEKRQRPFSPLEIWGGIECTFNRVGERYFDQISLSGHAQRPEDLERFASLGIRTLRYPVLWERIAPGELRDADWSATDASLSTMRALGIKPIVGLVHHGSGPRHTSLIDPEFPKKLGLFAEAVAERYPWIEMVTPINEPLTTARFAGLYGIWYPHGRDDRTFVRALVNQCLATRQCLRAFKSVNADVALIQTEDLGKTYSTPTLGYQADFDNERRWLTFDLLCGRVGPDHPFWRYLTDHGASIPELESLVQEPTTPAMLGINHYLTSERFLDDRVELYPQRVRGGNGQHQYADVEAVRVLENGIAGHLGLLREAWDRYGLPIAVTEVHLGCTREQQLRWLDEAWTSACELRDEGCDIRAVTVWSLLGSFGWDSLLTREGGAYEPGAFDVRSSPPRRTALGAMTRALACTGEFHHPVLDGHGWWRLRRRLAYPGYRAPHVVRALRRERASGAPLLITGATGTLGRAFARICGERGIRYRGFTHAELDVTDPLSIAAVLRDLKPWAVVNAAGYVRVDDAEWDTASCHRVNTDGAANLAAACATRGIRIVTFSSDLVFDGNRDAPYTEHALPNPLGVYGKSKANAEERMLRLAAQPLIVRTSAFFGPWDSYNFLAKTLAALENGLPVEAADDVVVSPTYVPDLVNTTLDLLIDDERGLWHLANDGATTWADFARGAAECAGLDASLVIGKPGSSLGYVASRPRYSVLGSARGKLMPSLENAIARYTAECAQLLAADAQAANA